MASRFATESQWNADPSLIPAGDYCFVLPDNFTGTSGVFRFKVGSLPLKRFTQIPWAPNPVYVTLPETAFAGLTDTQLRAAPIEVTITQGATPSGLNLELTQLQVLLALQQFQFDGSGNLKTTGGGGGGGGIVDQGAAGVDPWLVSVVNFPGTQPISGSVSVSNFPATQAISAVSLPLPTGASTSALQTTGNTSLSNIDGKLPALVGGRVPTDGSGVVQPVSGTFWQATQPVSGPLTDAELRLTPVPVSLAGTVPVSGTVNQGNAGVQKWLVDGSGVTQPVSAASLPLPTGASTEATLASILAQLQATIAVTQSGTWTVQPGNTANTTAWKVDASSVAIPLAAGSAAIGTVEVTKTPKSSSANTPAIVTSTGDVLASNASRKCWGITNLGTNTLYVRMATGASTSVFHFALGPGQVNDDGNGGSVANDVYTGVVSIAGTSPRCTVYEL